MKEMSATRHNRNRQCLRTRPVHHVGEQHGVVHFAMDHQSAGVGGDGVIRLVQHLRSRLGPTLQLFAGIGEWLGSEAAAARWEVENSMPRSSVPSRKVPLPCAVMTCI